MKKIISVLFLISLVLLLPACKKKPSSTAKTQTTTEEAHTTEEATSETNPVSGEEIATNEPLSTEEPVSTSTQSSGGEGANSAQSGEKPKSTQAPSTSTKAPVTTTKTEQNQNQNSNSNSNQATQVKYFEFCGNFFSTDQTVTLDVYLMTDEKEISIYPCVALYRYENNTWVPYSGLYEAGEFFALEATSGEVLTSNGIKHGRWDYMSNEILKNDPNANVETDFSQSKLIRRFKIQITEPGTYNADVTDGPNDSQKNDSQKHYYNSCRSCGNG